MVGRTSLDSYIIINDVILFITISIIHVHVIFNVNFIYSATISYIRKDRRRFAFCNGIVYCGTLCMIF